MNAPVEAVSAGARPPRLSGLLRLALPIVVSRSSQVVVGVSDTVMVASLGEAWAAREREIHTWLSTLDTH